MKYQNLLNKKLIKANEIGSQLDSNTKSIPIEKALLFILDRYNKGNYHGTISIKIAGPIVSNPKEDDVTHRLNSLYEEEDYND